MVVVQNEGFQPSRQANERIYEYRVGRFEKEHEIHMKQLYKRRNRQEIEERM